jgi:phosphatidylglycerophosphatase A
MKNILSNWFSTVFKIGYLPIAPGTWGSLAALLIWYIIIGHISSITLIVLIAIIFALGVYTSSVIENNISKKDPSIIVIDEWVGQWIALLFLPKSILWGLAAFLLFRLFDIWKPYPIKKLDNMTGGLGIMLDDVLAGIYALVIISILRTWII